MAARINVSPRPEWTPAAPERARPPRCCARCRRGVPGFGELPCGYSGDCKCHHKTETKETEQ